MLLLSVDELLGQSSKDRDKVGRNLNSKKQRSLTGQNAPPPRAQMKDPNRGISVSEKIFGERLLRSQNKRPSTVGNRFFGERGKSWEGYYPPSKSAKLWSDRTSFSGSGIAVSEPFGSANVKRQTFSPRSISSSIFGEGSGAIMASPPRSAPIFGERSLSKVNIKPRSVSASIFGEGSGAITANSPRSISIFGERSLRKQKIQTKSISADVFGERKVGREKVIPRSISRKQTGERRLAKISVKPRSISVENTGERRLSKVSINPRSISGQSTGERKLRVNQVEVRSVSAKMFGERKVRKEKMVPRSISGKYTGERKLRKTETKPRSVSSEEFGERKLRKEKVAIRSISAKQTGERKIKRVKIETRSISSELSGERKLRKKKVAPRSVTQFGERKFSQNARGISRERRQRLKVSNVGEFGVSYKRINRTGKGRHSSASTYYRIKSREQKPVNKRNKITEFWRGLFSSPASPKNLRKKPKKPRYDSREAKIWNP